MLLDVNLLSEREQGWILPPNLHTCGNARGLYNPMQFVLRLHPDIHKELDSIRPGIRPVTELQFKSLQAFSTYFHETIHWWQHVGSTLGLMLSLIYPAQAHINHRDLINLLKDIGAIKSILKYDSIHSTPLNQEEESDRRTNRVLNNWHDIEFFRWLAIDPKRASNIIRSPYFECLGHSYNMSWASIIWLLASTVDRDFDILPDIRAWEKEFQILNQKKVLGFYYGSDVLLPPLGAREIFEGQARFSQLQLLYFSSEEQINWRDLDSIGMLNGVYREAFDIFLKILGLPWPSSPGDPLVGLFLLVCDIAINPTDGFPFDIYGFPSFVISVDPGMRFFALCQSIRHSQQNLLGSIQKYTREEYMEVSEILCKEIGCRTPSAAAEKISTWTSNYHGCRELLKEDDLFQFSFENLPVRVFFARFLRFQHDKLKAPEYFCWPGAWSVGDRKEGIGLEKAGELFETHRALFADKADGGVYPRTFPDKDEQIVQRTFDAFYSWNAIYELTRQWIVDEGAFDFDFSWLTTKYSQPEVAEWVSNQFKNVYGVNPGSFQIL